jgi:hypothetical protein
LLQDREVDPMRLLDLRPQFMKVIDATHFQNVDSIGEADGIRFLCPKCFAVQMNGGIHSIFCWRPRVPQTIRPTPGRWEFEGTGYADLSLVAASSSILLTGGCAAHFHITNGEIA